MIGASMAVRPPRSRGPVLMMIDALRRIGGSLWMVDNAFTGAFVDNVGTTPVTAVGDLIGLITDKSYGGTLGHNLVTDGDFSSGTAGWTVPGGWALSSGAMVATSASSSLLQQGTVSTVGRSYEVEFDWTHTGGTLYVRVGAGTAVTFASSGRKRVILVAASTAGIEFYGGAVSGTLDNISVREVLGSHATQSAVASKPSVQRIGNATVINFDGSNDFLTTGITTGNEGWICAGVTFGAPLGNNETVFSNGAGSATLKGVWFVRLAGSGDSNAVRMGVGNGTALAHVLAPTGSNVLGTPRVVEGGWTASTVMVGVDGKTASAARTGDATPAQNPPLIGAYLSGFHHLQGPMHAMAYAPVLPDVATRKIIRDGIAALQGRTL